MAFALAVTNENSLLQDCPFISKEQFERLAGHVITRDQDEDLALTIAPMKKAIEGMNFSLIAEGLGAEIKGDDLQIRCFGKEFLITPFGEIKSQIHINQWVVMPLLKYILAGGSGGLTGKWVAFEELPGGLTMEQYIQRRCEDPMRQLADAHTDLFFNLLEIFGSSPAKGFSADYARVIHPLPRVPFLILYWRPEDQFESKLRILLDSSTSRYLDSHSVYVLARGMVEMFKKIISRHEELIPALLSL